MLHKREEGRVENRALGFVKISRRGARTAFPAGPSHMSLSDFNRLLVATPVPVERLDQLELEPEQPSSIAAIDADERFIEVLLAVL